MAGKPKDTRLASEQVAWVKHLPNEGGDWGRGLLSTVAAFESEADSLEADLAQAQAEHDAQVAKLKAAFDKKRAALQQGIKGRRKLASDAVKRADAEAGTLFANVQIDQAKARAGREQPRQQEGAPAPSPSAES